MFSWCSWKVGRRYNYFVHWKNTTDTENSWIPFSDIPNSLFHILDQFHCRNPSRPHPPRFLFSTNSIPPTSLKSFPSNHSHSHYQPTRSPSPPPEPSFRDYQPPVQQVTRSGRVVRPPPPKDDPWEGGNVIIDPLLLAVCFRLPPSGSFGLLLDCSYFRF